MTRTVFIRDAVRTPRAKARPDGGLAPLKPHQLLSDLIDSFAVRGIEAAPDALVVGAVGQVGAQGGNIALVTKLHAEMNDDVAAFSLNNYCASGLTAIGQAAAMIAAGNANSALAGGVEMMSRVPFMADRADYYQDATLPLRSRYIPVALAADRLAEHARVTRPMLDACALASHQKAAAAEGTPLTRSRVVIGGLDRDECVRPETTALSLAGLSPAFASLSDQYHDALAGAKIDHRHTVAHAPPMADGAALALLTAEGWQDTEARARIIAWCESGGDPEHALTAGLAAMERVLARAGMSLANMDCIEFMEAFAVTIAIFLRDYDVDPAKVNVGGGHLAKGHPMGASGAVLLSSLLDALDDRQGRYGLVVVSGASGVGSAMVIERLLP